MFAPNGRNEIRMSLKHCFPKGIPIIVMQKINPATRYPTPSSIPPKISQIIFNSRELVLSLNMTSFPNGKNES